MPIARILSLFLCLTFAAGAQAQSTQPGIGGEWAGAIKLPAGELKFGIKLTAGDNGWAGTISIPTQGITDLPVADLTVDGTHASFGLILPGNPRWDLSLADDKLTGTLMQAGTTLPVEMHRGSVQLKRPQEPTGELPYDVKQVTFPSKAEGVTLAGTLTTPKGDGPFPAVALVSGSGPTDRDETLLGHRIFYVLSDLLTRRGIAVLRYDDRGVGESTGDYAAATSLDFADDASGAVAFLKTLDMVNAAGIVGHSEGGIIGPLAAISDESIDFIVMLAGPGVSGADILTRQIRDGAIADGIDAAIADRRADAMKRLLDATTANDSEAALSAAGDLFRTSAGLGEDEALTPAMVTQQTAIAAQFATPWMSYFRNYDPAPTLAKVNQPVLALFGELDVQVSAKVNAPKIRDALADNADATVEVLPGLNHLFQPAKTGAGSEYAEIETTFDESAADRVAAWINTRFKAR